ncbi:hypothetical protein KM043_016716 [Ampulex compressa]|nr:hypothetical protein KM043_016716 [Ampulex compressa]
MNRVPREYVREGRHRAKTMGEERAGGKGKHRQGRRSQKALARPLASLHSVYLTYQGYLLLLEIKKKGRVRGRSEREKWRNQVAAVVPREEEKYLHQDSAAPMLPSARQPSAAREAWRGRGRSTRSLS